jgi:hypothetical protein
MGLAALGERQYFYAKNSSTWLPKRASSRISSLRNHWIHTFSGRIRLTIKHHGLKFFLFSLHGFWQAAAACEGSLMGSCPFLNNQESSYLPMLSCSPPLHTIRDGIDSQDQNLPYPAYLYHYQN